MEPDLNKLKNNRLNFAEVGILDSNTRPIIKRSWEYCKEINMDVNGGKGESGTGKEMFAHAIHRASAFSQGPIIVVNCACLPRNLEIV